MRRASLGLAAAAVSVLPFALELRVAESAQPLTNAWRAIPIAPRGSTRLGISFRPRQVEAFGLEARPTLRELLGYPFPLIRLGAYWSRVEPGPGQFDFSELDWQIESATAAGKQVILCVGAVKTFGYPEVFVPAHHLAGPLPEHHLVTPSTHPALLAAACEFVARVVDRYRDNANVVAWQVENEAVDPLGLEHSWRLAADFVAREVDAVRRIDPSRPIVLNGFWHASLAGRLAGWWQTRDQGDSLAAAVRLADIVGVDFYPRYAMKALGTRALYLDSSPSPWDRLRRRRWLGRPGGASRRVMVTEGQGEPWEALTVPSNIPGKGMFSCLPEHLIQSYNVWVEESKDGSSLDAYLFWGAEYWILRQQSGDPSYLRAFGRILEES